MKYAHDGRQVDAPVGKVHEPLLIKRQHLRYTQCQHREAEKGSHRHQVTARLEAPVPAVLVYATDVEKVVVVHPHVVLEALPQSKTPVRPILLHDLVSDELIHWIGFAQGRRGVGTAFLLWRRLVEASLLQYFLIGIVYVTVERRPAIIIELAAA